MVDKGTQSVRRLLKGEKYQHALLSILWSKSYIIGKENWKLVSFDEARMF